MFQQCVFWAISVTIYISISIKEGSCLSVCLFVLFSRPNRWTDPAQILHGATLEPRLRHRLFKFWVGVPKRVPILMPKTLKCNFEGEGGLQSRNVIK